MILDQLWSGSGSDGMGTGVWPRLFLWVRGCGLAYCLGAGVWPRLSSGCGVIRGNFGALFGLGFQKRKYILNCGTKSVDYRPISDGCGVGPNGCGVGPA